MSYSPGDYFTEAERKMIEISPDGSTKKYDDAAVLFQKAGTSFSKVRNYTRAGESFRRAADCMLHASKNEQAALFAAESGRNYVKDKEGEEKASEAFNLALQTYAELKKTIIADKLAIEAAKLFEGAKKYERAIHYHDIASQSYKAQNKTQDYFRERKAISSLYITAQKWNEASQNYENILTEMSEGGIEKNALEFGVRSIICLLAIADTTSARSANERFSTKNRLWAESDETKFVKQLIMTLVAMHVDDAERDCREFGQAHHYDLSFKKIIEGVTSKYKSISESA